MRFLEVYAQGFFGRGASRNGLDLAEYICSTKDEVKQVANIDYCKSKSNVGSFKLPQNFEEFSFSKDVTKLESAVDLADTIIFITVPTKNEENLDAVYHVADYAKKMGKQTVYFQFHHTASGLRSAFYTLPRYAAFMSKIDLVVTYSLFGGLHELAQRYDLKINRCLTRKNGLVNLFGLDFDSLRERYWQPSYAKLYRSLKFLGTSLKMKGYTIVRDLHWNYLKDNGYITTIEGIETAVYTLEDLFKEIKPKKIERDDVRAINHDKEALKLFKEGKLKFERNMPAYILPPFSNDDGLYRMAHSQFGTEMINMTDPEYEQDTFENVMLETIAVGAIPVFRKSWAENFKLRFGKESLINYSPEEIGTILIDEKSPEEGIALMNRLSDDLKAYDEFRENAYRFYSEHFSSKAIYPTLIAKIKEALTKPPADDFDISNL